MIYDEILNSFNDLPEVFVTLPRKFIRTSSPSRRLRDKPNKNKKRATTMARAVIEQMYSSHEED